MPFPKNVRLAADVAEELRGGKLVDYLDKELVLKGFSIKSSQAFGELVTMDCVNEVGEILRLYTFSQVVVDQCRDVQGSLPLIIIPKQVGKYMVIY